MTASMSFMDQEIAFSGPHGRGLENHVGHRRPVRRVDDRLHEQEFPREFPIVLHTVRRTDWRM